MDRAPYFRAWSISRLTADIHLGRFPFDQKFWEFRVGERMEQTFSGISFRNFGSTSRGWPKIPENRNNRKILFHSTIPAGAWVLRDWKSKFNMADPQASKHNTGPLSDKRLKYLTATLLQWISLTSFSE